MRGSNAKPASEASEAPFVPGEKEPRQKPKGNYRKALREIVENSWSCFTTVKTTGNIYLYNHYGATEKCDVLPVGTIVKLDNRKATGNRILIVDNSDSKINDKYVSLNSLNFELVEEQADASFQREYESVWSGDSENAYFSSQVFDKYVR